MRKGEWESLEIDGENVLRIFWVVSRKCCKCYKSQALPAKERKRSSGWRCGCSRCRYAGFGGITQGASAFSAGTASSRGPVLGPDQAVLRRLTLGSRTVPTPFFAAQRVTRDRVTPREVSGHVTGRLSVPNQSSFGELRMGPTLRDTLDNGLCCSSQGRGHVQSFENYSNVEVMPTTANYNLPHRTGRLS